MIAPRCLHVVDGATDSTNGDAQRLVSRHSTRWWIWEVPGFEREKNIHYTTYSITFRYSWALLTIPTSASSSCWAGADLPLPGIFKLVKFTMSSSDALTIPLVRLAPLAPVLRAGSSSRQNPVPDCRSFRSGARWLHKPILQDAIKFQFFHVLPRSWYVHGSMSKPIKTLAFSWFSWMTTTHSHRLYRYECAGPSPWRCLSAQYRPMLNRPVWTKSWEICRALCKPARACGTSLEEQKFDDCQPLCHNDG